MIRPETLAAALALRCPECAAEPGASCIHIVPGAQATFWRPQGWIGEATERPHNGRFAAVHAAARAQAAAARQRRLGDWLTANADLFESLAATGGR